MSDMNDIERLREERRQEMVEDATTPGDGESGDAPPPDEPFFVTGAGELDDTLQRYSVVLVEFYADWCGPCETMEPILEAVAEQANAAIAKIDVDANKQLASQFRVRGVPTMLLFDDGNVVEQMTGVRDQETLETLIGRYAG